MKFVVAVDRLHEKFFLFDNLRPFESRHSSVVEPPVVRTGRLAGVSIPRWGVDARSDPPRRVDALPTADPTSLRDGGAPRSRGLSSNAERRLKQPRRGLVFRNPGVHIWK